MAEMLTHALLIELILFLVGAPFGSCTNEIAGGDEDVPGLTPLSFPYSAHIGAQDGEEYIDYVIPLVRRNDFFLKAAKTVPRIGRRPQIFTLMHRADEHFSFKMLL